MGARVGEEEKRRKETEREERREERGERRKETNLGQAVRLRCSASPSGSIKSIQSIPSRGPPA
ncbi:MAG: hypothetical protein ACO3EP_11325, partial [Phycisphaerales bacterium]